MLLKEVQTLASLEILIPLHRIWLVNGISVYYCGPSF